jgi:hypothetical protein
VGKLCATVSYYSEDFHMDIRRAPIELEVSEAILFSKHHGFIGFRHSVRNVSYLCQFGTTGTGWSVHFAIYGIAYIFVFAGFFWSLTGLRISGEVSDTHTAGGSPPDVGASSMFRPSN